MSGCLRSHPEDLEAGSWVFSIQQYLSRIVNVNKFQPRSGFFIGNMFSPFSVAIYTIPYLLPDQCTSFSHLFQEGMSLRSSLCKPLRFERLYFYSRTEHEEIKALTLFQ